LWLVRAIPACDRTCCAKRCSMVDVDHIIAVGIRACALGQERRHVPQIGALAQQRPVLAVCDPAPGYSWSHLEVHNDAAPAQHPPVRRIHDCSTTDGDNPRTVRRQAIDHLRFEAAKLAFTARAEDVRNRTVDPLKLGIGVDEGDAQKARQPLAGRALPCAHEPRQCHVHMG